MKNTLTDKKFLEEYKYLHEFADEFLVICPKCANQAKVVLTENAEFNLANHLFLSRKLICSNCGFNKIKTRSQSGTGILFSIKKSDCSYVVIGGAFDWYFQQTL